MTLTYMYSVNRRARNSIDHFTLAKSTGSPITTSPGMLSSSDLPSTPSTTMRGVYPGGRGKLPRDDPVIPSIGGIGPILTNEDSYDSPALALDSPMSHNGEPHHINGDLLLDGGLGSERPKPQIDVFSDKAVKIDEGGLDQIFASDEEDESQEVREKYHYVMNERFIPHIINYRELK